MPEVAVRASLGDLCGLCGKIRFPMRDAQNEAELARVLSPALYAAAGISRVLGDGEATKRANKAAEKWDHCRRANMELISGEGLSGHGSRCRACKIAKTPSRTTDCPNVSKLGPTKR